MFGGVLDAVEGVDRAAGYALPEEDVRTAGGGEGRHDEELADAGDQVAADRVVVGVLGARAQTVDVGDGEGALRLRVGERAASRPNMETSSPLPADTRTRSYVREK